jgi:tripeptide aminopeptidase
LPMLINKDRLLSSLRELLLIDSPSGHEQAIARHLANELESIGCKVVYDANGNIIASLAGEGESLLLNAHMDTIQPTTGIKIIEGEDRWQTDGTTILGADDKAGLAVILEAIRSLKEKGVRHRPLEVIFTVNEEIMMKGARCLDYSLVSAKTGIGLDTRGPAINVAASAPAYTTIEVKIKGKAAHAGTTPEKGINAIVVASEAIARLPWGRIDKETTANVGVIHGGVARNTVPETAVVTMEVRSRDENKFKAKVDCIVKTFREAADHYGASVQIDLRDGCRAFNIGRNSVIVSMISKSAIDLGMEPTFNATGGVFDASIFNERGISTVVFGIGYELNHSSSEYLVIADFVRSAELLFTVLKIG